MRSSLLGCPVIGVAGAGACEKRIARGPRFCRSRAGFTLVEVMIAIGVAVVSLMGIFVLMQTGLSNYREAMNSTITATIGQQMISQYLLAGFDTIQTKPPQTNWFDERGLELPDTNKDQAVYRSLSQTEVPADLGISGNDLLKLKVNITSPTQPALSKVIISLIARQGKDTP